MELLLNRYDQSERGTSGMLFINGKPFGFTVEKPWKDNQKSISCIPAGKYVVKFNENPTPLTMEYRKRYDFFSFHLELMNVKNRSGIYFHVANKPEDVEGCIGLGSSCGEIGSHIIYSSRKAYKRFYLLMKGAMTKGEIIHVVIDNKKM